MKINTHPMEQSGRYNGQGTDAVPASSRRMMPRAGVSDDRVEISAGALARFRHEAAASRERAEIGALAGRLLPEVRAAIAAESRESGAAGLTAGRTVTEAALAETAEILLGLFA